MGLFNINHGFPEALCRGFRSGFLTSDDYKKLGACETLEDIRTALEDTEYGSFLQDEPAPLLVPTIISKCREKLAEEFSFIRGQSVGDLEKFLDFVRYEKMIDNVVMIIQGTLNNKSIKELLARVDPLGYFDELKTIPSIDISHGLEDLYRTILIETPLGPYFQDFLETVASQDSGRETTDVATILGEADLEILKNILKKRWLEEFHLFCQSIGGTTAEIMGHMLRSEADFRVLMVTLNALNSPLGTAQQLSDRNALYPSFGYLYPEGTDRVRKAWNEQTVRTALEPFTKYSALYEQVKTFYDKDSKVEKNSKYRSIEDLLYAENCMLFELAFENQFHFGIFYAWVKLREQEIRNIEWIANMVQMGRKEHVDDIVPIFAKRE